MSLFTRAVARMAGLPAATHRVAVQRGLRVPMDDGVELVADRYVPLRDRTAPVILLRGPYGRAQDATVARLFAERGYQVLIVSCRGTFGSGGTYRPFHDDRADGEATLAWVAAQPWFTGRLGTYGQSYLGMTQWASLAQPPEFWRAAAVGVTTSTPYHSMISPDGLFALEGIALWTFGMHVQELPLHRRLARIATLQRGMPAVFDRLPLSDVDTAVVGHSVGWFQDWLRHEEFDWEPIDWSDHVKDAPPAVSVTGWWDVFTAHQLRDYQALRAAGRPARLTVGPWFHGHRANKLATVREALTLFDATLRRGEELPSEVRVHIMGAAREWRTYPEWPPPADERTWFLGAGGTLGAEPGGEPDRYTYDPADPTPADGGVVLNPLHAGHKDQRAREARPDVLVYTSPALAAPATVLGTGRVELHLSSTVEHLDLFVRLCDVDLRGRSRNVTDGVVRLGPDDVVRHADGTFAATVPLFPTGYQFAAGHRVRLQVSGGAFPRYARNLGTGEHPATAVRAVAGEQNVFHDAARPSALVLPLV